MPVLKNQNWPHYHSISYLDVEKNYKKDGAFFIRNGERYQQIPIKEANDMFDQQEAAYNILLKRLAEIDPDESPYPKGYSFSRERPLWICAV